MHTTELARWILKRDPGGDATEPQEYSIKSQQELTDPGRYIPIVFLLFSEGSHLGS